jgi:DnaK suppressor protein
MLLMQLKSPTIKYHGRQAGKDGPIVQEAAPKSLTCYSCLVQAGSRSCPNPSLWRSDVWIASTSGDVVSKTKELKSSTKAQVKRASTKKSAAKTPAAAKTASSSNASAAAVKRPSKKSATGKPVAATAELAPAKTTQSKSKQSRPVKTSPTAEAKPQPKPKAASTTKKTANKPTRKKVSKTGSYLNIVLPAGYMPSDSDVFMSEEHKAYFRQKLMAWKEDIIRQTRETLVELTEASVQHADVADRATSETDRALELRARDRQRKLVSKINAALARIDEGSYGYCDETGEPIGLRRLEARSIATLSLEAQERHERRERVFRED